jgi:hypothetical protein
MVLRLNSSNGRFYFFFLLFISSHNLPKINWNPWSAISSVHTKARSPKLRPSQTRSIFFINISFELSVFLSPLSLGSYLSFFYVPIFFSLFQSLSLFFLSIHSYLSLYFNILSICLLMFISVSFNVSIFFYTYLHGHICLSVFMLLFISIFFY